MRKAMRSFTLPGILVILIVFVLPLSFIAYTDALNSDNGAGTASGGARVPVHPWTPRVAPFEGPAAPLPESALPGVSTTLSQTTWTHIGPAPLSSQSNNGNVSGRIAGIAVDPTNSNNIYVAPAGGGVWLTADGGTNWTPLTDSQVTLSMGAIALAPNNPLKVYAGTGEANNSLDSNYGRGILVSSNGGSTWSLSTGPSGILNTAGFTIAQISVDPTNANTAYAAVSQAGHNGAGGSGTGIYKTTDGGGTWTNVTAANSKDNNNSWTAVVVDPNSPSIVYAAVGNSNGFSTNGVYRSTNSGSTWGLLANAPNGASRGRIALAVAPSANSSGNHVLYVAVDSPSSGVNFFGVSNNADAATPAFTDHTSATPDFLDGQGWYDIVIGVDPSNAAIVYASGVQNYSVGDNQNLVLRSTTSGASWTDISVINGSMPHTDSHAMAFDSSNRMLIGNDGGIYRYDPASPGWTDLNGNLETIQFTGIGLHPTNPSIAIGGSQDNGTEVYNGALLWTETDGGDGGFAKFSQTNGLRAYHQIPYLSFGTNFFRRSDDGGNTWVTKTTGPDADGSSQNFYAPFVVDPGNGDHVLFGTFQVWETTTAGDSWNLIGAAGTAGFNNSSNNVDAIGLARSDANTLYASTGGEFATTSQIFVTTTHGSSWTEHDLGVSGRVNDIQVDPTNAQIAYAVVNSLNGLSGHVFKTVNGGGVWTNISGNLPVEPVWSLQIDPSAAGTLYVGADDGVYATTNGGTTWARFGAGLPHAQAVQIELNSTLHILGAATHGRSMWEILTSAPGGLAANFGSSGLWFYRNGAWSEITSLSPGMMAAYSTDMVAIFQGAGLYQYNGSAWTQLTGLTSIDMMVGMPDRVYVDFTGAGLWQYNGAWTRITALNPNMMTAFGNNLLANFPGAGLYQFNGSSWTQLTPLSSADSMVADATTAYVDFPSAGLYAYSGGTWTGLTSLNTAMMAIYGTNTLAAKFTGFGLYSWNGSSWTQLTSIAAQGLIGTSAALYVNFGSSGVYQYNAGWTQITPLTPNLMGSLGTSLIANFSSNGLYAFDGSAWTQLTPTNSATAILQVNLP